IAPVVTPSAALAESLSEPAQLSFDSLSNNSPARMVTGLSLSRHAKDAAIHSWLKRVFDQLDENGDGLLNVDEMPASLRAQIKQWDANQNGLIDLVEFKRYM